MPHSKQLDTNAIALNIGAIESAAAQETPRPGNNPEPPILEVGDCLNGGREIHAFVCRLLGRQQTIAATYYQIAKGVIPAHRYGERSLIASKRGIAQVLAVGTGLVAHSPAASMQS